MLAVGAELKSTVAVTKGRQVVASHHIGDLEHLATYRSFLQAVEHLPRLYGVVPEVVAHDLHPEYLSTKFAARARPARWSACSTTTPTSRRAWSSTAGPSRCSAICFDGLGYGTDGTLWGGELLVADLAGFRRVGHLRPVVMPGGVAAIREPWRMAAAWLAATAGADAAIARLSRRRRAGAGASSTSPTTGAGPVTTAVGRLFDAVAALLGGRPRVTFEAQAAIELEAAARTVPRTAAPRYEGTVDAHRRRADDVAVLDPRTAARPPCSPTATRGAPGRVLAAGFHEALGARHGPAGGRGGRGRRRWTRSSSPAACSRTPASARSSRRRCGTAGLEVLTHDQIPANDGGISIGQAAVAAWRSGH